MLMIIWRVTGRRSRIRGPKAAAHRLGLSHSTVKHHLTNARSKVEAATTRSERQFNPKCMAQTAK
jgi:DNA-binding CsgD family transcriptional regulator